MRNLARISAVVAVFSMALLTADASRAQESGAPARPQIVKAQAYASIAPVPQGREFEIAVIADVSPGYHMNSHHPTEDYLIPTTVNTDVPKGIEQRDWNYPPGKMMKFGFSPTPLNVYEGHVVIRVKVTATPSAALGSIQVPLTLRYQACNETTCFPPAKVALNVTLQIVRPGTPSHSQHPEAFAKP